MSHGNPIIQAPMLGAVTSKMVAAANKANCLGSLPLKAFRDEAKKNQEHEWLSIWLSIWLGQDYKNLSFDSTETILKSLIK